MGHTDAVIIKHYLFTSRWQWQSKNTHDWLYWLKYTSDLQAFHKIKFIVSLWRCEKVLSWLQWLQNNI